MEDMRIRIIEDRINMLRQFVESIQYNVINYWKDLEERIARLEESLEELKKELEKINLKVNAILNQLPSFATKESVEKLERYIDMINPIELVSVKEVEKIVERKLREMLKREEKLII